MIIQVTFSLFHVTISSHVFVRVPLKPSESSSARDALAKAVYGRMFDYIVESVNNAIPFSTSASYIGILDIAGFGKLSVKMVIGFVCALTVPSVMSLVSCISFFNMFFIVILFIYVFYVNLFCIYFVIDIKFYIYIFYPYE